MRISTRNVFLFLALAQGLVGCGGPGSLPAPSSLAPSAPSPVPQPIPISLVVFTDPASGLSTSDVRDVQDQIVQFNSAGELIWTADGTRFPGYRAVPNRASPNLIRGPRRDDYFQVHFGTKNGERRAYFGWDVDACHCEGSPITIVDVEVVAGQLVITATGVTVPGT